MKPKYHVNHWGEECFTNHNQIRNFTKRLKVDYPELTQTLVGVSWIKKNDRRFVPGLAGRCIKTFIGGGSHIELHGDYPAIVTLLHEVAHALLNLISVPRHEGPHGPTFERVWRELANQCGHGSPDNITGALEESCWPEDEELMWSMAEHKAKRVFDKDFPPPWTPRLARFHVMYADRGYPEPGFLDDQDLVDAMVLEFKDVDFPISPYGTFDEATALCILGHWFDMA